MRAKGILRRVVRPCLPAVHAKRVETVVACAEAVIRAQKLTPAAIGRSLPGRPKHGIKRVDRLLANTALHTQRWVIFRALAHHLLARNPRPVIVVDWTQALGSFRALVAAVPVGGRAITILVQVHPEPKLSNSAVQRQFLRSLARVVPSRCRPTIVTDAGFHGPFFRDVEQLGWEFLGRIRGTATACRIADGRRMSKDDFYASATRHPTDLGEFDLYAAPRAMSARVILVHKPRKSRKLPPPTTKEEREYRKSCRDPWLLATSMRDSAAAVVNTYAKRMQIEETFRDAKNHRFGWSFRAARSACPDRIATLLMLAALAMYAVTIVGLAAEQLGAQAAYRANTVARRVLSLFVLGCHVLQRQDMAFANRSAWDKAIRALRQAARCGL
jgi:Transposase DDE domain